MAFNLNRHFHVRTSCIAREYLRWRNNILYENPMQNWGTFTLPFFNISFALCSFLARFVCLYGFILLCVNLFSFMLCVKTFFFPSELCEILGNLTLSDPTSDLVRQYDFPVLLRCRKTSDTVFVAFVRPLPEPVRRFSSCSMDFSQQIAQVVLFLFLHVFLL
jgi:hypothetical protein